MPAGPPPPVRTPCVKVCAVDGENGLCLGCLRTLSEIAGWAGLPEPERDRIMAELPGRAGLIRPGKRGFS